MNLDKILRSFPKERPPLPPAYQSIYEEHYANNRQGNTRATSLSSRLERWLHRTVAADVVSGAKDALTLEIGAGTLNHLPYEPSVSQYDVVEPAAFLLEKGTSHSRVRNFYKDISELPPGARYDRILAIATFEHITDLPAVAARSAQLLKGNGCLRVSIPNEGTLFWKLGTLITGYEFRKKYGLDYQVLMRHEHINTASEIEGVLRYFFRRIHARSFGLNSRLAFYRFFECREPELDKAGQYIANI